jgi:hypothetical protein
MTPAVYITAALIGAIAALLGVGLKMLYDVITDRARRVREDGTLLLTDRKAVFDEFLRRNRAYRKYSEQFHQLVEMAQRGEEPPPGTLETFPGSPLGELVESLEDVRRHARTYAVIHAADAIVRLYGDMATAQKATLDNFAHPDNELTWFLLCRFAEDREREFVHAYRQELGLGTPQGAPIGYMAPRHPQLNLAEHTLRAHVTGRRASATPRGDDSDERKAMPAVEARTATVEEPKSHAHRSASGPDSRGAGRPGPEVEGWSAGRRGRPAPPEAAP